VADVALKARSLHERKQKKKFVQGHNHWSRQIDKTNTQPQKPTNHDNPQISQPDLRFASGERKQTAKTKTKHKTGPPRDRFAIRRSGLSTASFVKACQMS